jgi:rhodanese-related sulfurtransferase
VARRGDPPYGDGLRFRLQPDIRTLSIMDAVSFFTAKLSFETDVSDVAEALAAGEPGFTLVDTRAIGAWRQGHIPGAVHLPRTMIPVRAAKLLDPAVPVVTYCWGPGCNGATRSALALAERGYRVREMIGGIEYWIREGFAVQTPDGLVSEAVDPRTAPAPAPAQAQARAPAPGQAPAPAPAARPASGLPAGGV